ncbi:hypothetical protein NL676_032274 [Syzygium grande]|nr:hypothetical protein NL676_032274 [Syzygium grande]
MLPKFGDADVAEVLEAEVGLVLGGPPEIGRWGKPGDSSKAWVAPPGSGHIFLREVCTLLVCRPCPPSSFRTQLLKRYHCFDEDFPPDGSLSNRPDLPLD